MTSTASHPIQTQSNADCITLQLPRWLLHDLMQPLNAYWLVSEQIKDNLPPTLVGNDDLLSAWRMMDNAIRSHEENLRALRLFWQLHSEKRPFTLSSISLSSVASLLRARLRTNPPYIDVEFQGFNELRILSNPDRLVEILFNLCDNARIHARRELNVVAYACTDGVRIDVIDDGLGLSSGLIDDLGKPFIRYAGTHAPKRRSLGLGIHIATETASRMKGHRLEVTNLAEKGCCFSLTVPSASIEPREAMTLSDIDPINGARILVHDRDEHFAHGLCNLLRSWHCAVTFIRAWDDLILPKRRTQPVDLLMITHDAWMTSGQQFVDAIKLLQAHMPVVFVLMDDRKALQQEKLSPRMNPALHVQLLQRPISPTKLRATLTNALVERQGGAR